jgi:hypothetical protein
MSPRLPELRSSDHNGRGTRCVFCFPQVAHSKRTTLRDKSTCRYVKGRLPWEDEQRADFVAEYSAFVLTPRRHQRHD